MSIETMTKLSTITVGVGGAASIDFTNIPQNYTDLLIKVSSRATTTNNEFNLTFNGISTGYIGSRVLYSTGSAAGSYTGGTTFIDGSNTEPSNYTASIFASADIYISQYSGYNPKVVSIESVQENNATASINQIGAGMLNNPLPITRITLTRAFDQHSTATLYGIKNARATAGNSVKATGGAISFDGTYVYHTFYSSGTFTPSQSISADVLVVAGGAAGGWDGGGGGGAGGIIYFAGQSLTTSGQTITVGAGGVGGGIGVNPGSPGNNSSFGSLAAAIGGGGGGGGNVDNAATGGSGGGGGQEGSRPGKASIQTGTGATAFYGNSGGQGKGTSGGSGGGGGGAGTAGTSSSNQAGGGNGTTAFSTWGAAASAGQNVNGTYYFAGGGGGGTGWGVAGGAGGFGGGGTGGGPNTTQPTAGTTNTGGGGGGGNGNPANSASGGSGIVIVRYKAQ